MHAYSPFSYAYGFGASPFSAYGNPFAYNPYSIAGLGSPFSAYSPYSNPFSLSNPYSSLPYGYSGFNAAAVASAGAPPPPPPPPSSQAQYNQGKCPNCPNAY